MKKIIPLIVILVAMSFFVSVSVVESAYPRNDDQQDDILKLDVVFVIDSTGSMSDEIREVKMHIRNIIEELQNGTPPPDMNVGFVAYRDYPDEEDEYVHKLFLLTSDIDEALSNLDGIDACGGGDYKEVVTIGLDVAINEMNWRESDNNITYDDNQNPIFSNTSTRRMMFLIGDAPPRTKRYQDSSGDEEIPLDYTINIDDAKEKNIIICTVSGSGMNSEGVSIWKEIAEQTFGEYKSLTYETQVLMDYVEERGLDEEWVDTARESGDYDPAGGTITTNNLGDFVKSNVQLQAELMGSEYNSSVAQNVGDLGFFFDNTDDGEYDSFYYHGNGRKVPFEQQDEETYMIDSDEDGAWDWSYNIETDTLAALGEIDDQPEENNEKTNKKQNPLILIPGFVIIIALITIMIYLYVIKQK